MKRNPNKHFSAHAGHVFLQDVIAVSIENEITYVGRADILPKGKMVFEINEFLATQDGYETPKEAFMATHEMLNKTDGLGKCFLGYDPFEDEK